MSRPATASLPTLVVAARSARLMAQAARRDGFHVVALDAFGDADTRRAAHVWHSIAVRGRSTIDPDAVLQALAHWRTETDPIGWVAGSDLDHHPSLLAEGANHLPLIGTAPQDVARVRDPAGFFAALDALGLAHPPTQIEAPADPRGWLRKLGRGCGGWHIRRAEAGLASASASADDLPYYQREAPGQPMSALFIARADGHRTVGLNHLRVRPQGALPHVYRGAVGPVALAPEAHATLDAAIGRLVVHFRLRGLCSLDGLWHEGRWSLLEINPRPSASMALYAHEPLMREHVAACGALASAVATPATPAASRPGSPVRGLETVFARTAFTLDAAQAQALAARGDAHDLPAAGCTFEAGDPVCSVSAVGNNVEAVCEQLDHKRRTLRAAWACQ